MPSPVCDQAIRDVLRVGSALVKFIAPNDTGLTRSHQKGIYLPKAAWEVFTPFAPKKGVNHDHRIEAVWQDGRVTRSTVKWYGRETRSEYRLTGFNRERNFPFTAADRVGSLLVLVPERRDRFLMYVLDSDDDIEELQAGVGVEALEGWGVYSRGAATVATEDACLDRRFRAFSLSLTRFPTTLEFSKEAREALIACVRSFLDSPSDQLLTRCVDAEYALFKFVERHLCKPEISRVFRSVDEFLSLAQTILQRRKSRAGWSLEHHVAYLLKKERIPFEPRVKVDGTRPDLIIPGKREYLDDSYPISKLFAVGLKTTCKDRWRQVLREAPRVVNKHILTLQKGISPAQLEEMRSSHVTLVVPESLHVDYRKADRKHILSVDHFLSNLKAALAA